MAPRRVKACRDRRPPHLMTEKYLAPPTKRPRTLSWDTGSCYPPRD